MEVRERKRRGRVPERLVTLALFCLFLFPCRAMGQPAGMAGGTIAGPAEVARHAKLTLYKTPGTFLFLLPGVCGFFLLGFLRKKKMGNAVAAAPLFIMILLATAGGGADSNGSIAQGVEAYEHGQYKEARALFALSRAHGIELPYIEYDIALCFLAEENPPAALAELYRPTRNDRGTR